MKGFKHYTLDTYQQGGYAVVETLDVINNHQPTIKRFYRKGTDNPNGPGTYSTSRNQYFIGRSPGGLEAPLNTNYPPNYEGTVDFDDSYIFNELEYFNVNFSESDILGSTNHKFAVINFDSTTGSYIKSPDRYNFNFNLKKDFSISFYIKPNPPNASTTEKRYIIAKNGTKTSYGETIPTGNSLPSQLSDSPLNAQFPFEIYMISQSLYFDRSDGRITDSINGEITASSGAQLQTSHILCQITSSKMQIYFNGTKIAEKTSTLKDSTKNKANLYIGSRGPKGTYDDSADNIEKYFNGDISNINIFSKKFSQTQINNISESVSASPYVGNLFYQSGLGVITHPKYNDILTGSNSINTLQFQGSHLIFEHEYQCTVLEHEFNNTYNSSTIDQTGIDPYKIEGFTTSSFWKPYVTTIGLYNEMNELLVVGKLGQPIRMSDETDTTFVVRWDS